MLKTDDSVPQISLFKHRRVKGWWPFHVKNEGSEELELTVGFPTETMTNCTITSSLDHAFGIGPRPDTQCGYIISNNHNNNKLRSFLTMDWYTITASAFRDKFRLIYVE